MPNREFVTSLCYAHEINVSSFEITIMCETCIETYISENQ